MHEERIGLCPCGVGCRRAPEEMSPSAPRHSHARNGARQEPARSQPRHKPRTRPPLHRRALFSLSSLAISTAVNRQRFLGCLSTGELPRSSCRGGAVADLDSGFWPYSRRLGSGSSRNWMVSLPLSFSRPPTLWIAVAKGSVATTLVIALTFVRVFDELIAHPLALNGVSRYSEPQPLPCQPWPARAGVSSATDLADETSVVL